MSDYIFSLMERLQKIDCLLAQTRRRRRVDPAEVLRLRALKGAVKRPTAATLARRIVAAA